MKKTDGKELTGWRRSTERTATEQESDKKTAQPMKKQHMMQNYSHETDTTQNRDLTSPYNEAVISACSSSPIGKTSIWEICHIKRSIVSLIPDIPKKPLLGRSHRRTLTSEKRQTRLKFTHVGCIQGVHFDSRLTDCPLQGQKSMKQTTWTMMISCEHFGQWHKSWKIPMETVTHHLPIHISFAIHITFHHISLPSLFKVVGAWHTGPTWSNQSIQSLVNTGDEIAGDLIDAEIQVAPRLQ